MKSFFKIIFCVYLLVGFSSSISAAGFGEYEYNDGGGGVDISETSSPCTDTKDSYCLLEPLPIGNGNGAPLDRIDVTNSFGSYINIIVKILIGVVGVLAVVTIVLGGVQYMTTDAFSGKEGGKEMITRSVFGLLIALGSVLLLNTINPQLTSVGLNFDGVSVHGDGYNTISKVSGDSGSFDNGSGENNPSATLTEMCEDTRPTNLSCNAPACAGYADQIIDVVGSDNDMAKFLKANMVEESTCNVAARSSAGACGLFQQLPSTAERYKVICGVPTNTQITCDWLTNPANVRADICIQKKFIEEVKASQCGSKTENVIAAQAAGIGACGTSVDCQNETSCVNGDTVRQWECPWDNPDHTSLNTGHNETRRAVKKMRYCYNHPEF